MKLVTNHMTVMVGDIIETIKQTDGENGKNVGK